MTGPEHYRKAEELAAEAVKVSPVFYPPGQHPNCVTGTVHAEELIALAHVHATLALAAATAVGAFPGGGIDQGAHMPIDDAKAWDEVAGVPIP